MYTETFLSNDDLNIDFQKLKLPKINNDDIQNIEYYIEITRHIQEIYELFNIFIFNLDNILTYYELRNDDTITRKSSLISDNSDFTIINALTFNYISSSKTLIESIENFMNINVDKKSKIYNSFMYDCIKNTYDKNFYYRFLIRLRSFYQHGHLPICINKNNKCYFNLEQILYTPHFNHNTKLKSELENIKQDILFNFKDHPHIVFTKCIAEFNICIIKIYDNFLKTFKTILTESKNNIDLIIKHNPSILNKSDNAFDGWIFYKTSEDRTVHCFNPKDDPIKILLEMQSKTSLILLKEETELENLNKSYKRNSK